MMISTTMTRSIMALFMMVATTSAFTAVDLPSRTAVVGATSSVELNMAKGFDDNAKPVKREKSVGQQKREKANAKYDEIATSGGQEYNIFVRQFGGEDDSWLPCGSIAVPRTLQVSTAIFENEVALQSSIVRQFPKLKGYELEFEYGYNLKIYPDDPVEIANKGKAKQESGMSFGGWVSNLLSPIDASQTGKQ